MFKDEAFQYIPSVKLFSAKEVNLKCKAPACDVLISGETIEGALPLSLALKKFGPYIERRIAGSLKASHCPFLLENIAADRQGAFLHIAPESKVELKIAIEAASRYQKLMIFVGRGAQVKLWLLPFGDCSRCHTWIDVTVDKGAKLESIILDDRKSEGVQLTHVESSVMQGARFEQKILISEGFLKRYRFDASIEGSGAHAEIKELAVGSSNSEHHLYSKIHHKAPSSTSDQLSKHLLFDESRASFTGKIHIDSIAQLSNAYQLSNSLLVSKGAIAHSKPGLEVFADDVKASHGATISSIDPELLFYLHSRGLGQKEALAFLIRSFPKELLSSLDEAIATQWNEKIHEKGLSVL